LKFLDEVIAIIRKAPDAEAARLITRDVRQFWKRAAFAKRKKIEDDIKSRIKTLICWICR
jgi:hypothetical protein